LDRAKHAFDVVARYRDPSRDIIFDKITELEQLRDGEKLKLQQLVDMLAGSVTAAVAKQFASMSERIAAMETEIAGHHTKLMHLDLHRSERPAEYDALIADYKSGGGPARDRAVRLLNQALKSVIGRIEIDFAKELTSRGQWRMSTINEWAVTDANSTGWRTKMQAISEAMDPKRPLMRTTCRSLLQAGRPGGGARIIAKRHKEGGRINPAKPRSVQSVDLGLSVRRRSFCAFHGRLRQR
jgi:hypothetical protein